MRSPSTLVVLIAIALALSACSMRNQPPIIESLSVSEHELYVGDTATLRVQASDPDGDALSVAWSTTDGSFESVDGERAVWLATVPGEHIIRVEVRDANGASNQGQIALTVRGYVTVPRQTEVSLELLTDVYADSLRIGDRFPLRVSEAVYVDGYEVVAQGAYAIAQVLHVQMPDTGSGAGVVLLAPTRIQLADGRLTTLSTPKGTASVTGSGVEPTSNSTVQGGVAFMFTMDEPRVVSAGTSLKAVLESEVQLGVASGVVLPSAEAQPAPVDPVACLGIHGADIAEYVLSVYSDGVRVAGFHTNTDAARSGIQVGDRIAGIRIAGEEYYIANLADMQRIERTLTPGDQVVVLVRNLIRKLDVPLTVSSCYTVT